MYKKEDAIWEENERINEAVLPEKKTVYKSFSQQLRECTANGTLFRVKIPGHKNDGLACAKYRTTCSSKVCRAERDPQMIEYPVFHEDY